MGRLEEINEIVKVAELGGNNFRKLFLADRISFGQGDTGIHFSGENIKLYDKYLKSLFNNETTIPKWYTLKAFEERLIKIVCEHVISKTAVSKSAVSSFFSDLLNAPMMDFSVFRNVHGIELADHAKSYQVGPFSIFHFDSHCEQLNVRAKADLREFWQGESQSYIVEIVVSAKCPDKAIEIADLLFEKFEACMRFSIGCYRHSHYEIGVLNYSGWRNQHLLIFDGEGGISGSSRKHRFSEPIAVDTGLIVDEAYGFERIWQIPANPNASALQKQLLLAIVWVGHAHNEISSSSALLKATIALEILFSPEQKSYAFRPQQPV